MFTQTSPEMKQFSKRDSASPSWVAANGGMPSSEGGRVAPAAPADFRPFAFSEIQQGIHERFEKVAAERGAAPAVVMPGRVVTYGELNAHANALARCLVGLRGTALQQVAILLPNDYQAIVGLFGAYKANKAVVPIDPQFPRERVDYMLADSEATLIVTNRELESYARELAGKKHDLLNLDTLGADPLAENLGLACDPMQLAYILYTSGTTGRPKGIGFVHRNLLHTKMCLINALRISPSDRLTQLHSVAFAASVVDIYGSLLTGACLYPWDVKDRGFVGLGKWIGEQGVTSIQWIPTPFRHLLQSLPAEQRFPQVRLVVMASEPLTARDFDLYKEHFGESCFLVNQLGTSESYNYRLFFANHQTVLRGAYVPGGYAVSEQREVLILGEKRERLPLGATGEIGVRSAYMSIGYWKQPELTAEKFLVDPEDGSQRIYLTGDLGQLLADGCLLHLGRKDSQVKIRGYRVELAEIECVLNSLAGVKDAAVVCRPDHMGELRIFAYLVAKASEPPLSLDQVRAEVARRLPDYMVPAYFTILPTFPVLPTGKLDKASLPVVDTRARGLGHAAIAACGQVEEEACEAFREVLRVEAVGSQDSFFEIGGDSLQAACLLSRLSDRFQCEITMRDFLPAPTPAGVARFLEAQRSGRPLTAASDNQGAWPRERLWRGALNRLLQVVALYAPGLSTTRVWLHRLRGVRIGRGVNIGTGALIETKYPQLVAIGSNVAIGIRCVIIGHFSESIDLPKSLNEPTVRIEDDVFVGPSVTILPNVTIGRGSVVAAGSIVTKSVPPQTMVQGNPAEPVAKCGIPLMGSAYADFIRQLSLLSRKGQIGGG